MRATLLLLLTCGCFSDEPSDEAYQGTAQWEELSEDDLDTWADKDTGKSDECGDEVVEGEPCEGDWTVTMCQDEYGEWWWCEDGVWTSDKDE